MIKLPTLSEKQDFYWLDVFNEPQKAVNAFWLKREKNDFDQDDFTKQDFYWLDAFNQPQKALNAWKQGLEPQFKVLTCKINANMHFDSSERKMTLIKTISQNINYLSNGWRKVLT